MYYVPGVAAVFRCVCMMNIHSSSSSSSSDMTEICVVALRMRHTANYAADKC
jgi:hypothetical protein